MAIQFGREITGQLPIAEQREWLVTNGIGGYACGTIAGTLTRHYHGTLIAALTPPLQRTLVLTKLEETVYHHQHRYALYTNRWADGVVSPLGYQCLEQFTLEGRVPTWTFACGDARLEKRLWMPWGRNETFVLYRLRRSREPIVLAVECLVNWRGHHGGGSRPEWDSRLIAQGMKLQAVGSHTPLYLLSDRGRMNDCYSWHLGFSLRREQERGTGNCEDHLHVATIETTLHPGETLTLLASLHEPVTLLDGWKSLVESRQRDRELLQIWRSHPATPPVSTEPSLADPLWIQQLVLAADSFIVQRTQPDGSSGHSIIAGYPWFSDWGRDAAIALPGLTLATGRYEIARSVLRSLSHFFQRGLLPNVFPETNSPAIYNTIDATLWYVEAIRAYLAATDDLDLLRELFPHLVTAINFYRDGTDFEIGMDREDGLIRGGTIDTQLTWMDVKVNNWAVTPRSGKAVEINALWYNALRSMQQFSTQLAQDPEPYELLANRAGRGFQRFWNPSKGCCYDVIDTPTGDDARLRPNQIFAVSLHHSPLSENRQRLVVETCSAHLLTSFGLRSLAANQPDYQGRYDGDVQARDRAYHQGTVWGWLIGAFVIAHLRVYQDWQTARDFLTPFANHLQDAGLGNISEIFDGDPVHTPRGCIAQAWSVAEVLRAWRAIETLRHQPNPSPTI